MCLKIKNYYLKFFVEIRRMKKYMKIREILFKN